MSAINLRSVKREFAQLNYRPEVCHSNLVDELKIILECTGLVQEYDIVQNEINAHSLINIIQHVCKVCYTNIHNEQIVNHFFTFIVKIYTEHCSDETVKRSVAKCLKTCPENRQNELSIAMSCQLMSLMENKRDLGETEYLLKTLNNCCEQFPSLIDGCIEKTIVFLEHCFQKSYGILINESSPAQKISAIRCIHEGFRFFLTTHRKNMFPNTMKSLIGLKDCFLNLIDNEHLPMETLFNCSLSLLYFYIEDQSNSPLQCWKECLQNFQSQSDLVKLGFCVAIINTFTSKDLKIIDPTNGKSIYSSILTIVIDAYHRNVNDTSIIISISRVILILSKRLSTNIEVDLNKYELQSLINFIWLHLDHYLDGVRHFARDTMINIIKIKDEFVLNQILNHVSTCNKNSKAFVTVLMIISDKVDCEKIINYMPNIAESLLELMNSNNSAVMVFKSLMLNHFSTTDCKVWFDFWLCPLFGNSNKLDIKHFEQILTKAVELSPNIIKHIQDLSSKNELSLKIYLICLKIEKQIYLKNNKNEDWMNETNFKTLKRALHNKDENICFIAVNLILDCLKKTQPFNNKELELMKYFITYNIKNEKAAVKQTNLSFVKKMLLRMNESHLSFIVRSNESLKTTVTKSYTEFQHWFSNLCFSNLFYDANFSRRNFSLQSLRLIQTCLSPAGIVGINESKNVFKLLNCICDTYEQNKILAKDILTYKNHESIKLDNLIIEDILKTAKMLASSTSPPDCITSGYLLEVVIFFSQNNNYEELTYSITLDLMNELKKEVELAEKNLTLASAKGPMYGLIHTIRHLLNTLNWECNILTNKWIIFIENISKICLKCIKLVSIVVNDSSPEGIVPMDDLCQNDCQVTSQMVLLCCWRTTKESSLLLGDVVYIVSKQESEFSNSLIKKICSCLTLLLSETKHRGAFEQIFVAYSKICSIMWKSPSLHFIPQDYLEGVLTEVKTGLGETFCVTRRSAGMPFIIQALICTNHDKRKIVNYTMNTLICICENKNITEDCEVGVVHALNVLRALFRCSQLGELVGPFVSRAINISILLFNSSLWPIRNSSTLLLSTLVTRVFGVPRSSTEISWKNRMTGREFFQRYPKLYDTFLNEFKKFSPLDMRPSLYPTLLILARLYPSINETNDCTFQLAAYVPYIFKCAQSPVMKTRMLAATSIASQITQNKLVDHLYITFNELTKKNLKENTIHGLLLQMFSLVENLPSLENKDEDKLTSLTKDILTKYNQFVNCSYVVQEVFLRCITCLWLQLKCLQYDSIKFLFSLVLESVTNVTQFNAIGRSKYLKSAILFLFSINIKAKYDISLIIFDLLKNNIHSEIIFKILGIILCKKTIEICHDLEKLKNLEYWDQKILFDQLIANKNLIELVCQQCIKIDTLVDAKFWVLSNYAPALHMYFKNYESINDFISKTFDLRKDTEIAQVLLCINGHFCNLKSLEQTLIIKLTHLFENIYYGQRSDDCKIGCIDIIVNNYNLLIQNDSSDITIFLKLWTLIIHYAEDNSEEVRNHVWCLVNNDTNCAKSFELLFDKFAKHFDQFPSVVLIALACWSYLDVELPQDRSEGQVFDGGDTCEFKEHTIRQNLSLSMMLHLTNGNPTSNNLEISKCLQEWIIEEWNFDIEPTAQNLKTVGDFTMFAKEYYSRINKLIKKSTF